MRGREQAAAAAFHTQKFMRLFFFPLPCRKIRDAGLDAIHLFLQALQFLLACLRAEIPFRKQVEQNVPRGHKSFFTCPSQHVQLFQRPVDVPYTYIPQNQYYHITVTQQKKLFEMIRYA